ncbi:MAG: crossover junction endodeoxyribonuclease RuvC [Patescibacteria group bacterium]|nr:crossover junction endodeoxyribonuclease RuvC [Patescibacteria group bacterium]
MSNKKGRLALSSTLRDEHRSDSNESDSRRVLAVDPGFDRIGLAVMKLERDTLKLLFSECLKTDSKKARPERLLSIGRRIKDVIEKWRPATLAIETLFFNTNITSAIGVAEARGIIIYEATKAGMKIFEYGPQTIKIAVTGYGRADKVQMESMVKKLVDLPRKSLKRLDDEVDAIAVGITHLASKKDRG